MNYFTWTATMIVILSKKNDLVLIVGYNTSHFSHGLWPWSQSRQQRAFFSLFAWTQPWSQYLKNVIIIILCRDSDDLKTLVFLLIFLASGKMSQEKIFDNLGSAWRANRWRWRTSIDQKRKSIVEQEICYDINEKESKYE